MKVQELAYILSCETKLDIEARSRNDGYSSIATSIKMEDIEKLEYRDANVVVMCPSAMNTMIVIIDKVVE